ncbi:MAG: FKBP-type peptidyl-prolyl cis-trans isomerase [Cyclobacteriaceae bacterium]|nr:FKBP-type peptidyl-prolyl cis-trans isomerase [Cyclobacteriaceae bacterium]MDH4295246.1 FKBP-type peptidyl-prolyl cis-trans isomerase [Cyclobacteriaceae bacterium]
MRYSILVLALLIASPLFSQSKKDLLGQVEALKKETEQLRSEIELLKHPKEIELADTLRKVSYGLGTLVATNLRMQGGDSLNLEALTDGIKDVYLSKALKMEQEEALAIVQVYMQEVADKKKLKLIEEGAAFLAENKTLPGVTTTDSGLQYKVISAGTGKSPLPTDNVTVHYTGKLIDGSVFDSSVARNEPVTFDVNGVIPGWTEALQLMHEGDKWTLYIPYPLAYGERGAGDQIPPYSTLIFEVELIKIN